MPESPVSSCRTNKSGRTPHSSLAASDQADAGLSRRQVLAASAIAIAGSTIGTTIAGCSSGQPDGKTEPTPAGRPDVPLRVVWVGRAGDAEVVQRAWGAVMPQSLKFDTIELDRSNTSGLLESLTAKAKKSDLIVSPLMAAAALREAEAVVPISDDEVAASEQTLGRLYPLAKAASKFAGETIGIPIGLRLPALLTVDEVDDLHSWEDYDRWVQQDLDGAAAEPLSPGWAGSMFLWRAASTIDQGWLFGRKDFQPIIQSNDYIDVLTLMAKTAARYKSGRQTPAQIWSNLQSGELRGGIGFEVATEEEGADVTASNPPGLAGVNKLLLDPFSPVVSLSASCRQSSAAKSLLQWLTGGDGSDNVRRQVDALSVTRSQASDDTRGRSDSGYSRWLRERLATPLKMPPMQLLAADEYYAVLDQQISDCIDGKTEPATALKTVADTWQSITTRVGVEIQQRAWRRSEGMKA